MVAPEVTLTHLNRADGSATYTHHGYSIIGAVNGPIEVQRRDEQPEEATLEVNVRPSAGVGSTSPLHNTRVQLLTLRQHHANATWKRYCTPRSAASSSHASSRARSCRSRCKCAASPRKTHRPASTPA
ncbi:exosome non-catalytic core subunit rrp46 [Ascochyta rabiei]|uniref:exosome non-catalytic core subunit rrp46 n=1 Tax=Didymella rabiei TaxID=5454 RepID=UPI002207D583|nr:exosome non-catalytic core subunit rrp46 [Ascochyta rabiei]UPX14740.1 exosome non-catalytic core subunit rrp46 [Ascochyta rabiei]